ncbi:TPA: hypothetical protein ACX8VE_001711 [Campylobacter jejuni]|nr:hypothetical protein [Campylobacter jejuni]
MLDKEENEILATKDHYYFDEGLGVERSKHNILVKSFKRKDQFIKFFAENLMTLNQLTPHEVKFFVNCLSFMNYQNTIIINGDFRKDVAAQMKISLPAVSKHLKSLIDKEILIHLDPDDLDEETKEALKLGNHQKKMYLISPKVVGKGSFRDLAEVRQILVKKFNFNEMKYSQEIIDERIYSGSTSINSKDYEIKQINNLQTPNSDKTTIVVGEKDKKQAIEHIPEEKNKDILQIYNLLQNVIKEEKDSFFEKMKRIESLVTSVQEKLIENDHIEEYMNLKNSFEIGKEND